VAVTANYVKYEAVLIDREHFSVQTVSSDEEQELDSPENDSPHKQEQEAQVKSRNATKNPLEIRRQSKVRMLTFKSNALKSDTAMQLDSRLIRTRTNNGYLSANTNGIIKRLIET